MQKMRPVQTVKSGVAAGKQSRPPVYVTRAVVPDLNEYETYLKDIFSTRHMTNHGSCVGRLETRLAAHLNVPFLMLCANGTLALQLAAHAAGLAGREVVTTPFSYAATVSALLWVGCTVRFADIEEETCCLDPKKVAEQITPATGGILPVHVYGNVCDVDALGSVAQDAGLPVVYDAAQCFGGRYRGRSVLDYGDYAVGSFHATKVFHTVEGGCVVARTTEDREKLGLLRACGHSGDVHIRLGTNAKLSELHAAVGLCLLDRVEDNIARRKAVARMYDALLPERGLRRPGLKAGLDYNHAYYPVIFETEEALLRAVAGMNRENIFPRRYFYPALNTLPYLAATQSCPVAESLALRVLCLPLYAELAEETVERIARIVRLSTAS
jgi:dTDP-4-amino-4,6-dideoxygalactose transaminase